MAVHKRITAAVAVALLLAIGLASNSACAEPDDEFVEVTGRVIDDERFPLSGASIVFRPRGRAPVHAVSAEDGTFRLKAGPLAPRFMRREPGGGLLITRKASDGTWRAAISHVRFSPWLRVRRHLGHFALNPACVVDVRVMGGSGPVAGAKVHVRGASYAASELDVQETGADGLARIGPLPHGTYEFFAMVQGHRRGYGAHKVTADSGPVELALTAPRDIALRVIDSETKKGIEGARVIALDPRRNLSQRRMPPVSIPPTAADGKTELCGAGRHVMIKLLVRAPGYVRHRFDVASGETSKTLALVKGTTTLRWKLADPSGAPPEGTRLEIIPAWASYASPPVGRIEDGHVVVPDWPGESGLGDAAAPDGSVADLGYDLRPRGTGRERGPGSLKVVYKPTRFVRPRVLQLRILESDGTPAARRWIAIEGVDFFFTEADRPARNVAGFKRTDVDGRVAFKAVYTDEVTVKLLAAGTEHHDVILGTVPVERIGQTPLTFKLPESRPVRLAIRVDGRKALPADLRIVFDGKPIRSMEEDPVGAVLGFRIRHPRLQVSETLTVQTGSAQGAIEIQLSEGGPISSTVHVETRPSRHELLLRVEPAGRFGFIPQAVQLHRWDASTKRWAHAWQLGRRFTPPGASQNERVIDGLQAGRYRAVDTTSGVVSKTVDVGPGQERPTLGFDRSRTRSLMARVILPKGLLRFDARLDIVGAAPNLDYRYRNYPEPAPRRIKDGAFELLVPADGKLVIRATHPLCKPAEVAIGPGETPKIDLRLKRRPTALIDLGAKPDLRFENPGEPRWSHAPYRYRKPEEICKVYARLSADEAWRIIPTFFDSHYEDFEMPGDAGKSYRLRIDVPGWAPVVLEGVAPSLERPPTYTVPLVKGSTIQVTFDLPNGATIDWMHAVATSQSTPTYTRRTRGEKINPNWRRLRGMYDLVDGGVLLEGLGAGRFELESSVSFTLDGERRNLRRFRTIEVDGTTKKHVVFRAR